MPTLLELQTAMRGCLVQNDKETISALLAPGIGVDRLDIYRNTFLVTLTKALRICFPATEKLVGAVFFEAAAQVFVEAQPPASAWLDLYGAEFSEFLRGFPPAATVPYLADVAALEWAVSNALHAPALPSLDVARLASVDGEDQLIFTPHPSIRVLRLGSPADLIWQAVLAGDDNALGKIHPGAGPVHLLVERLSTELNIARLDEPDWLFLANLCHGAALGPLLEMSVGVDSTSALAAHLASGRFVAFRVGANDDRQTRGERV